MSNDLNRNYNVYINNRFTFEKYFQEQSLLRALPEAYLIDSNGDILMSRVYTIFTQYYRPRSEVIKRAANGELAIMTSTTVNKVYALIKLPNFINAYLYVGRPLDPSVTKAFDETKSAITEYSNLENNRTQIAVVFMLIYILAILILIFVVLHLTYYCKLFYQVVEINYYNELHDLLYLNHVYLRVQPFVYIHVVTNIALQNH